MTFQVGDTVQLKSGGPIMTVEKASKGEVTCVWFDEKNQCQSKFFVPEVLKKADGFPRFA